MSFVETYCRCCGLLLTAEEARGAGPHYAACDPCLLDLCDPQDVSPEGRRPVHFRATVQSVAFTTRRAWRAFARAVAA